MSTLRQRGLALVGLFFFTLSLPLFASSKAQLEALLPQVKAIAAQSDVTSAVAAANQAHANLTKTDVRNLGKQWHEGLNGKTSDILNQVNASTLSASLKNIVAQSNGAYAGILVTDSRGLVIGQTYNADHYSQARRSIWSKIPKEGVNAVYYGKAKQSSEGNLATLGLPILQNNQVIGAILVEAKVTASTSAERSHRSRKTTAANS